MKSNITLSILIFCFSISTSLSASTTPQVTIECPPNITISTDLDGCVATNPNISEPTTGGDPGEVVTNDAPSEFPLGVTTVTWTVTDGTDTESCQQVITVVDDVAPALPERLAWDDLNTVSNITDPNINTSYADVMDIDGENIIVGAAQGPYGGSAFILEYSNGEWTEEHELAATGIPSNSNYGRSVAIDGDYALVGARAFNTDSYGEGKVFVFEKDASGDWVASAELLASDKANRDWFGCAVAIEGEYALIGAYGQDDQGSSSGCVYVFERDSNGDWTELGKLYGSDNSIGDVFGSEIDMEGDTAIISAFRDDPIVDDEGSVYVFAHDGSGTFTEVQKLNYSAAQPDERYGEAITVNGNYLLMGSHDYGVNIGAAALFEKDANGLFQELQLLTAPDGNWADFFSIAGMAIDDDILAINSRDESAHYNSGAIYTYERQQDGSWIFTDKIRPNSINHHIMGNSIQFHNSGQMIAGAPSYGSSVNYEDAVYYINSSIATTLIDASVGCGESVPSPTLEDNCAGTIVGITTDALPTATIDEYNVTWDFDDGNGNVSSYDQLVNVYDGIPPTVTCEDVTVTVDPDNPFVLTEAELGVTYSDLCSDVEVLTSPNVYIDCNDVGVQSYIVQVRDESLNRSECYGNITVLPASDVVGNLNDSGTESLRSLVNEGCAGDTIFFHGSLAGGTITLQSEIDITKSKVIVGLGENDLTIDGDNANRIFHITNSNLDVHMSGLKLINGYDATQGGAILNEGDLFLSDMIFDNNNENTTPKPWTNLKDVEISAGTVDIKE